MDVHNMDNKKRLMIVVLIVFVLMVLLSLTLGGWLFLHFNHLPDTPTPITLFSYWSNGLAIKFNLAYKAGVAIAVLLPTLTSIFIGIALTKKPKRELHGSARFANLSEVTKAGLFNEKPKDPEILIGQYKGKYLRWAGKQFGFLAAPTRSGKGVGIVIPNCLNYRDSLIVFDPKLENFKLTSGYRKHILNQEVLLFNPSTSQKDGYRSHCWNPLSYVSRNRLRTVGDALNIANILYSTSEDSGGGNAKFFAEMAQKLFLGLVLYMIEYEKLYKGTDIWQDSDTPTLARLLALTTPKGYKNLSIWIKDVVVASDEFSDTCKNNLLSYATTSEATGASILSSLIAPLSVFNDEIINRITCKDDFDLRDIRKKRMTIYLGIKPNDIAKFSRLINLFFSQLISVNTEELPEDNPELKYQVLLLIDEFAAIGKVEIIEKSVAYIAGYNLRLFPIFQNMSQLNSLYTKDGARSLSTNFECHIIYPPRDNEDAKEYSEIIGYETFKAVGTSKNRGQIMSGSESISDQRRAVMNPDELRTMPTTDCIISMTGIPPIRAKKIVYYKDPFFIERLNFQPPEIPLLGIEVEQSAVNDISQDLGEDELLSDYQAYVFSLLATSNNQLQVNKSFEAQLKSVCKDIIRTRDMLLFGRTTPLST